MIELIEEYLNDWIKKRVILEILASKGVTMDERTWRKAVELHNEKYVEHETDRFLAHSSKGYKLTTNKDEILLSTRDYHKRAMDLLVKESKIKRAMGENDNLRLEIKDGTLIVVEI